MVGRVSLKGLYGRVTLHILSWRGGGVGGTSTVQWTVRGDHSLGGTVNSVTGGLNSTTTSLCVYSSFTQSWVHVGEAPITINVATPCAVALPSNELMVVNGQRVFKIMLQSKSGHLFTATKLLLCRSLACLYNIILMVDIKLDYI